MLSKVVPRMKSKHCGAGLALSLMDLRFRMSTYVDRQPLSALTWLVSFRDRPSRSAGRPRCKVTRKTKAWIARCLSAYRQPQPQRLCSTGSGGVPPAGNARLDYLLKIRLRYSTTLSKTIANVSLNFAF